MNKVIFITGSAKRIGAHLADFFHSQGYNVALHYCHSQSSAQRLEKKLNRRRHHSAISLQADFSLEHFSYDALLAQVVQTWGRLDIVLNNASSFYATPLNTIKQSNWQELVNSNLKAPLFLAQAAASALRKHQGCIINILDASIQKPINNYAVYNLAKAGLANLSVTLAKELAPTIRVNSISPGNILWAEQEQKTAAARAAALKKIPLQRQGSVEDIAQAAYFLAQAHYITGQNIYVDGGASLL